MPKLNLIRNENQELLFLDDLTQEDKFYLIQQIESKMTQRNIRYDHSKRAPSGDDLPSDTPLVKESGKK